MTKLRITWKKSFVGHHRRQREVVRSLGLRRLHQTVVHEDTPTIRGMVRKVSHLVEVVEEEEER